MKYILTAFLAILIFSDVYSQEFPKGWVMYFNGHQGIATTFRRSPDLYIGGVDLSPQYTVLPGLLRIGVTVGGFFNRKQFFADYGPNVSLHLKTISVGSFGSILNLQLQLEHLWGTDNQRLLGGGIKAELAQLIEIGVSAHRDYNLNVWWFQCGIGYNILHKKRGSKPTDPFSHP